MPAAASRMSGRRRACRRNMGAARLRGPGPGPLGLSLLNVRPLCVVLLEMRLAARGRIRPPDVAIGSGVRSSAMIKAALLIATPPAIAVAVIPAPPAARRAPVTVAGLAIVRLAVDIAAEPVLRAVDSRAFVPGHYAI